VLVSLLPGVEGVELAVEGSGLGVASVIALDGLVGVAGAGACVSVRTRALVEDELDSGSRLALLDALLLAALRAGAFATGASSLGLGATGAALGVLGWAGELPTSSAAAALLTSAGAVAAGAALFASATIAGLVARAGAAVSELLRL